MYPCDSITLFCDSVTLLCDSITLFYAKHRVNFEVSEIFWLTF